MLGQELVQGWVDQADDHGQSVHGLQDPIEVTRLESAQRLQCRQVRLAGLRIAFLGLRRGQDHLLDQRRATLLTEHVLRAHQSDATRAQRPRSSDFLGRVSIRPHADGARFVGPAEQRDELGFAIEVGLDRIDAASEHLARGAVQRDPVAFAQRRAIGRQPLVRHVDVDVFGAGNTRFAHLAGDHGGVTGRATPRSQNAHGRSHAVKVFGRRLLAGQHNRLTFGGQFRRAIRVEHHFADGRAW